MKKFLSILLALVLTAGMGFSFLAYAVKIEDSTTIDQNSSEGSAFLGSIMGSYASATVDKLYYVVIEGIDDLNFEYNPGGGSVWNPELLMDENHAKYNWTNGYSRVITVYNRSNAPVNVTPSLNSKENTGVKVEIDRDNNVPFKVKAALEGTQKGYEPRETITLQLTATGQPNPDWDDFTTGHSVATLKITLAAVSENQ